MISLVLFPLLCVIYLYQTKAFQNEYAIEVNVWNKSDGKRIKEMYGWEEYPPRKYLDFILVGNDVEDERTLNQAQMELRKIVKTKDTINGVHFCFNNNAHYWTLISTHNRFDIEKVQYYVTKENHIWMYHSNPKPYVEDTTLTHPYCGNTAAGFYDNEAQERSIKLQENEEKYLNLLKQFLGPGLLFLLLLILSIFNLKIQNKTFKGK